MSFFNIFQAVCGCLMYAGGIALGVLSITFTGPLAPVAVLAGGSLCEMFGGGMLIGWSFS